MIPRTIMFLFLFVLMEGCDGSRIPSSPAPDSLFVELYAERLILREEATLLRADSIWILQHLDSLNRRFGVTSAQVDSTLAAYRSDPVRWKLLTDQLVRALERKRVRESTPQPPKADTTGARRP